MSAADAPRSPVATTPAVNPLLNAARLGLQRGWIESVQSLRSSQDVSFYLFTAAIVVAYLWIRRDSDVEGTTLSFPTVALPSLLAALVAFGLVTTPMFTLTGGREDGTLLRAKATPHGLSGFVTGMVVSTALTLLPQFLVILVPCALLFGDLMSDGGGGWVTLAWVLLLGMLATVPIGIAIGAVVPNTQRAFTWGMLPVLGLTAISGIFFPIQQLWVWLQVVAQLFPVYWLGLGMRSAFLPESAASLELTGSWRSGWTAAVLLAWGVAGLLLAPVLLRRTARRQSGSQVEAAREAALQWVR